MIQAERVVAMTEAILRAMRRVAREAIAQTIQEYAEPLVWLARKLAGLAPPARRTTDQETSRAFLLRVLADFEPRLVHAMMLYYGFEPNSEGMDMAEISALTGVSPEELRRVRELAFDRLRRHYPDEAPPEVLSRKRAWGE